MASGKSSRAKGVTGERESADVFRRHGFEVVRLQNNVLDAGDFTATLRSVTLLREPGPYDRSVVDIGSADLTVLVDAKRRERLHLLAASRQIEAVAVNGQVPCVVYRSNREPWRASLLLDDFARLLGTP
jgi:Holliday junction resolvase